MLEGRQLKGGKNKYDPQIGEAAKANAALAARAQDFSENFTNTYLVPLTQQMVKESDTNLERQGKLFDIQYGQAQLQDERYRKLGIPAEDRYYDMVSNYSEGSEQTRQADRALGDVRVAASNAKKGTSRQLASLGIAPNSPAAIAAVSNLNVQQGAMEAAAATRAREAAKTLGMSLTADAANFGRGGQAGILSFSQGAGGSAGQALGGAQSSIGAASGGAAVNQGAYGLGIKAYGQNLDAYTQLGKQSMQSSSGGGILGGLGKLAGTWVGAGMPIPSDRRLKKNIRKLARMPNGLNLYEFSYKNDSDGTKRVGFMADEVEQLYPDAVSERPDGMKLVDYSKAVF